MIAWTLLIGGFTVYAAGTIRYRGRGDGMIRAYLVSDLLSAPGLALWHWWWLAVPFAAMAVFWAIYLWRRRKRKRALRELGYKARARLAAVVRRAREAAQPQPVLVPQRQGAP